MRKNYFYLALLVFLISWGGTAQVTELAKPVFMGSSQSLHTGALSEKDLLPPTGEITKIYNPRNRGSNKVVPGKGYPKTEDAAWQKQPGEIDSKKPILSYDAATSGSTPSDPTGAIGPNHYVNAWNTSFAIYDKEGNVLSPPAALASLGGAFTGEDLGDPIVFYDEFADRFLITQFSDTPNSFLVAVSQGPDPVNDGWYTYRFETGNTFPDYPKFFVWSDGYYITTNKDSNSASESEVIYVLERDKILEGEEAQHVGFPLPGIRNNGFYSPAGFFAVGDELPPPGNAPIIYFQDDAWEGVDEDHLKIWEINMDWENLEESSIEESQNLGGDDGVSPFIATFDGGSFTNLSQPGDAPDIDALQGAVMYMTPYRRFPTHNSVVLNFVVDLDASAAEHAGIRWYELRQDSDGEPWTVYQEGTYAPDSNDRFCGSIGIDEKGNIGLGFTVLNDNNEDPLFPSLRYTGRYVTDPLGRMTLREASIVEGPSPNPSTRYGDYAHLTIDPLDNQTFWYIGEYFVNQERRNRVGVFRLEPEENDDVGIVDVVSPQDATLGEEEELTVTIRNFGLDTQTSVPLEFSVDGGQTFTETFTGELPRTSEEQFTFSTSVDLSDAGESYEFVVRTNLEGDENPENDEYSEIIEHLMPIDVGVTSIDAPITGLFQNTLEEVTVTIQNFGGEPQNNIPVSYSVNNGEEVSEVYEPTLEVGESDSYTFNAGADISQPGAYTFYATTSMPGDSDEANDDETEVIANLSCIPEGSDCSFGDGLSDFFLGGIENENIPCGNGYADFIGYSAELDRTQDSFEVTVRSRFASGEDEQFSMWIDFNDNGAFEDEERVLSSVVIPSEKENHTFEFSIPIDAPLGEHILRVRAGDTSYGGDLNDPCSVMEYGTTHDYSVEIIDDTMVDPELGLRDAELIVSSEDDEHFEIEMETTYEGTLILTVHNMLGQKLVENRVDRSIRGFTYQLDMSYAAPGVYLVRFGTRKVGRVERIIVR